MRLSRTAIAAAAITLMFCVTLPITLMGRNGPPTEQVQRDNGTNGSVLTKTDPDAAAPEAKRRLSEGEVASYVMSPLQIKPGDSSAHMFAQVDFMNSDPTTSYVWGLRIYSSRGGDPVVDRLYDQQVFSMVSPESTLIDFNEDVRMLPGAYRAHVQLFEVHGPQQLEKLRAMLKNGEKVGGFRACENLKDFAIQQKMATSSKKKK